MVHVVGEVCGVCGGGGCVVHVVGEVCGTSYPTDHDQLSTHPLMSPSILLPSSWKIPFWTILKDFTHIPSSDRCFELGGIEPCVCVGGVRRFGGGGEEEEVRRDGV